jgi:hypothetical protein
MDYALFEDCGDDDTLIAAVLPAREIKCIKVKYRFSCLPVYIPFDIADSSVQEHARYLKTG